MQQNEIITLKTPQQPRHRLFAVASEKIHGNISERKYWQDKDSGQMYAILGVIPIAKNEHVPAVLQYMSLGQVMTAEEIWKKRITNSEFLYFLICEPIEEDKE